MKLRLAFLTALCLNVCFAAPSRIARQAQSPVSAPLNPQQFAVPPPKRFSSQATQLVRVSPAQQHGVASQRLKQFIPDGQFFPIVNPVVPPAVAETVPQSVPVSPNSAFPEAALSPQSPLPQHRPSVNIEENTSAPAAETHAPPTPRIVPPPVDKNVDLDGDGALSLAEVQYAAFVHHGLSSSVVETMFNQVDKNKDGYLTSIEFNEIRPLVLAKAENAALRYMNSVDSDHNGLLSLSEAQTYILKEYAISSRDVERIWRLVVPSSSDEMDAVLFSKLRRRVRGMSIRLARQIMKNADVNQDGHIDLREAQMIAFEMEGIGAGDVIEILASVDDNNDGELNAPEFADFQRIVRARAIETSKKALKVVDTDGSGTLTMDEAKRIAFDHYGFDERTLEPFFAQADENENSNLDAVEFAGFRTVIRSRAVKNAQALLPEVDTDGDGFVSTLEAEEKGRREDDMDPKETLNLFNVADQDKNGVLDKVELADFVRLVRLSAIRYASEHLREFDINRDKKVTVNELQTLIEEKYNLDPAVTRDFFDKVDVDFSGNLNPGEIVDFRHEVRKFVAERDARLEVEAQHRREMAEIEAKLRHETESKSKALNSELNDDQVDGKENVEEPIDIEVEEEAEEEENEEEEEEITTTTTTTQAPKKKRPSRKHKTTVTTTTATTEAPIIEDKETFDKSIENELEATTETEPFTDDTLPRKKADSVHVGVKEAANVIVKDNIVFVTAAPTIAKAVEEVTTDVSIKKKKKFKKPHFKTATVASVVETTPEAPNTFVSTVEKTTKAAINIPIKKITITENTEEVTTAVAISATGTEENVNENINQGPDVSSEEVITTPRPKKRRFHKKPKITTTTAAPEEEYEEEDEEDEDKEESNILKAQVPKKKKLI